VCAASFQTDIHHLSDPIDVYSEWIDQTETINRKHRKLADGDRSEAEEDEEEAAAREEDE
jgi:transcription elongation factor Elf1